MLKLFLAILMGMATPSSAPLTENCQEECTEENHVCDSNDEPNPGDIGYIPPKK